MKGKHVMMNFSKKFQQLSEQETAKQLKKNFRDVVKDPITGSSEHSAGREKYQYVDKFFRVREVDLTKVKPTTPKKSIIARMMEMESIRFTRLEGTYKWWKTLSPDVRNAIIPVCKFFLYGNSFEFPFWSCNLQQQQLLD